MLQVDLEFTKLEIFDDHVIVCVAADIDFDLGKYHQVAAIIAEHLKQPYGIILDEVYSYTISFDVLLALRENKHLACCAIVSYRPTTMVNLAQPLRFIGKPGTFCESVEDARFWVKDRISESRNSSTS